MKNVNSNGIKQNDPKHICANCTDFPCEHILAFESDGMPHHKDAVANLRSIREIGKEAWFKTIKPKLVCHCGERQTWYYTCSQHK